MASCSNGSHVSFLSCAAFEVVYCIMQFVCQSAPRKCLGHQKSAETLAFPWFMKPAVKFWDFVDRLLLAFHRVSCVCVFFYMNLCV